MTSAAEATAARTPLGADLAAGVEAISLNQQVTFTQYRRVVLPVDGFVFWVKADLVTGGAIFDAAGPYDDWLFDKSPTVVAADTIVATGSLHFATRRYQSEEANAAANDVVFTSEIPLDFFNSIDPQTMWIAQLPASEPHNRRYAFSARKNLYQQAGPLYHYLGASITSNMATQIVDSPLQFNAIGPVVSNSLPMWLQIPGYASPTGFFPVTAPFFPSMAVPDNQRPPYVVVHVAPEGTRALQAAPLFDANLGQTQLARDLVKLTTFGLRNADVLNLMAAVDQYSLETDNIGLMNMPIPRDAKQGQVEFFTLAQRKEIDFEVSYYQSTSRRVGTQLITSCIPTFVVDPLVAAD